MICHIPTHRGKVITLKQAGMNMQGIILEYLDTSALKKKVCRVNLFTLRNS